MIGDYKPVRVRKPYYAERVVRSDAGGELYAPARWVNDTLVESGDTPSYDREAVRRRCDQLNARPIEDESEGCGGDAILDRMVP